MRRAVSFLILLAACGSKDKGAQPSASSDAAASTRRPVKPPIAYAPDAGPVNHPGKDLSTPPAPVAADAKYCAQAGKYVVYSFTKVATQQQAPAAAVDGLVQALDLQWNGHCTNDQWPKMVVDCFEKGPDDVTTYERCIDRLPATAREEWDAQSDAIYQAAGATGPAHPAHGVAAPAGGVVWETLCAPYVAEVARFDDCSGGGMYVPEIEKVIHDARIAEVGGVIPPEQQAAIKKQCDDELPSIRDIEAEICPKVK